MKNEANKEVMEKLRKILKLAAGKGATENEIAVAMAKAKSLAREHQIEISSVNLQDDLTRPGGITIEKDDTLRTRSIYRQPYHRRIFNVLEEVFDVQIVWHGYSSSGGYRITQIDVIGETTDVAIAIAIYPFLEKAFPAGLSRKVSARELTYCAAHTNGFYLGFARGIILANQREEENMPAEQTQQWGLIVVKKDALIDAKLAELYKDLKRRKSRHQEMSSEALRLGKREGEKINLRQVGTGTAAKQLN